MILVSVGTHPQAFERLSRAVEKLANDKKIKDKIIFQTGVTRFTHPRVTSFDYLPIREYEKLLAKARVFITHAGEGQMGTGLQKGIPMVIVPRLAKYGEHTNDHQLELAEAAEKQGFGVVVYDLEKLPEAITQALKKKPIHLRSFAIQTLRGIAHEHEIFHAKKTKSMNNDSHSIPTSASIIVATLNGGEPLVRAVNGMLAQTFKGKYEIIVVDDGSFDGKTPELLKEHFGENTKVKLVFLPRSGVCKARNAGIRTAKYDVVINMDHDCIPEKDWLQTMVKGFDSPSVGAVSAYGHYGGTSTGFRKYILDHVQGYDEDYFYYREDTDLSFRIMELGFEYKKIPEARKYHEDRTLVSPKGIIPVLRYALQRFKYHMNDVLLYKKHSTEMCKEFLHIKWNIFVDPVQDFKVATGLWENDAKGISLSSPRGLTFFQNKSPLHFILIILGGIGYAFAMKWVRLAGSIRHGHLLV